MGSAPWKGDVSLPKTRVCAVVQVQNAATSIKNVLAQMTRAKVDYCILVNNGSKDDTQIVAEEFIRKEKRVQNNKFFILSVPSPLGHDVARAWGVYTAMRLKWQVDLYLFLDGDWQGGFGPKLEQWLADVLLMPAEVTYTIHSPRPAPVKFPLQIPFDRGYQVLWAQALETFAPSLKEAAISQLPMTIRATAFQYVSPYWLHQPGLWFAYCLLTEPRVNIQAVPGIDAKILGNPTRSRQHQKMMEDTLFGDALEGIRVIMGLSGGRYWRGNEWIGYHSQRRLDLLQQYMAQWDLTGQFLV